VTFSFQKIFQRERILTILRNGMIKIQVAMSALFGSLFFLLLPLYDILLQQNTVVNPILRIISILILLLSLISGGFTAKKIAYLFHDIHIAKQKNESTTIPALRQTLVNTPLLVTLLFFIMFLLMKTIFLKSVSFFLQSIFGSVISTFLSIIFFTMYVWSSFVLIEHHINEKNPDTYVSFWGKQFLHVHNVMNVSTNSVNSLPQKIFGFKPPFFR